MISLWLRMNHYAAVLSIDRIWLSLPGPLNSHLYLHQLFIFQLVGGEFDIETNFIIQEPQNILHMLRVFSSCTSTLQVSTGVSHPWDVTFTHAILVRPYLLHAVPMWCLVLMWCQVPIIYHTTHCIAHMIYYVHVMTHAHVISYPCDISCIIWCIMPI